MEEFILSPDEAERRISAILERACALGEFCTVQSFDSTCIYRSLWTPLTDTDQQQLNASNTPISLQLKKKLSSITQCYPFESMAVNASATSSVVWVETFQRNYALTPSPLVVAHHGLRYISFHQGSGLTTREETPSVILPGIGTEFIPEVEAIFSLAERAFGRH